MQQIKYKVVLHAPWIPDLQQQQGDSSIMEHVINSQSIHVQHYEPINWCRIYIKALLLSDICTLDRKYLDDCMYIDEPPTNDQYTLDMEWPQQGCPNKTSWKVYSGMLRKILCRADGRLHQLLGNWICVTWKWNWSFQRATETLYCQEGKTWIKYQLY
eukprot:13701420-Ditylum_brightwellii.AAC.2